MTKKETATPRKEESTADIINRIPNGIHLRRIREALRSGHAAVMVGSGFSLNAENGSRLPSWDGLINSLLEDLYATDEARLKAKTLLGGISGMLRLAEEYAAVRGRSQLERRMHELLPDAGIVMPGELHTKLLSLDWADVYTTNYDTLLERTLDTDRRALMSKIKRRYQIVVAASDVPFSKSNGRPRVVKLHGSLRAGSRLIISEDDYRSYPTDFAPFVNTVQQSMLENVFCLIGFSGDDPNFLLWTGWVRDRLGDETPPIYLITLKAMSEGERLILERRNIFPIDISELGSPDGEIDHAASLRALLDFWEAESPRRPAKWPFEQPTNFLGASPELPELVEWISSARRNRSDYPGWLVAPIDNRSSLSDCSSVWRAFSTYCQQKDAMPLWLRTVFLEEVMWILDTMLHPLTPKHAWEIEDLFSAASAKEILPVDIILPERACPIKPKHDELQTLTANLIVTMLRDAREDSDHQKFAHWKARLDLGAKSKLPPDIQRAALHEEVLLNLELRHLGNVHQLLEDLASVDGPMQDPYWRVRIGALFGEMGVLKRGSELVRKGLHSIRELIQAKTETVYLVSREHWAERVLKAFIVAQSGERLSKKTNFPTRNLSVPDSTRPESPIPEGLQTLILKAEELAESADEEDEEVNRDQNARERLDHPITQTYLLLHEIDIAAEELESADVDFDAQVLPDRYGASRIRSEAMDATWTFCRLAERAAFVPSIGRVGFSAGNWASCHRIRSSAASSEASLRLLLRVNSGSRWGSAETLTLASVATLSREIALKYFTQSVAEIEGILARAHHEWERTTISSLKFSMDFSSRIAFRLEVDQGIILVGLALRLYTLPQLQKEFPIHKPFGSFLSRGLHLLSPEALADVCPDLLSLSAPDEVLLRPQQWPNIVEILAQLEAFPKPGERWRTIVDDAIERAATSAVAASLSTSAIARLDWLHRHHLMSKAQKRRFASIIWQNAPDGELPVAPGFYRGAAMAWPWPPRKSPISLFRDWIIKEPVGRIEKPFEHNGKTMLGISVPSESLLVNILMTGNNHISFSWSQADLLLILDKLETWWKEEGLALLERALKDQSAGGTQEILTSRLRLISHAAQQIIAPGITRTVAIRRGISDWFAEMWKAGLQMANPPVPLLFAGLCWWPEKSMRVVEFTVSVLSGNRNRDAVNGALNAAGRWLLSETGPTESTRRYVTYLADSIQSPTERYLDLKLRSIRELLDLGAVRHFAPHARDLSVALASLLFELQDGQTGDNAFAFTSRPLLRVNCASLLSTMGLQMPDVAKNATWLAAVQMARYDSLLTVRNIVSTILH